MTALRPAAAPPPESGRHDGLAWTLHRPPGDVAGAVVILHGADSAKRSHGDFARACAAAGLAALAFDARGHGASDGPLDGRALDDVAEMAAVARERSGARAIGLRGSSMGGFLALAAAERAGAAAVVAICPASGEGLVRGLRSGRFAFAAHAPALETLLAGVDLARAAARLGARLLLQHAERDEVVPVAHSRALHAAAPGSRLAVSPGGDHRSVQHDPAHQAQAIAFLAAAAAAAEG